MCWFSWRAALGPSSWPGVPGVAPAALPLPALIPGYDGTASLKCGTGQSGARGHRSNQARRQASAGRGVPVRQMGVVGGAGSGPAGPWRHGAVAVPAAAPAPERETLSWKVPGKQLAVRITGVIPAKAGIHLSSWNKLLDRSPPRGDHGIQLGLTRRTTYLPGLSPLFCKTA